MANIKLENDELKLEISDLGAELVSLIDKKTDKEYMWCRDPKFWGKCSPVLFPFIGRCLDKEYTYKGVTYPMTIHGFASGSTFEVEKESENTASFTIRDTEETLKMYPFKFTFKVMFKLEGRKITVSFMVQNETDGEMYFMLGAHPGFRCPIDENEKRSNCFIQFPGLDEVSSRGVELPCGLVNEVYTVFELNDGFLPISDHLFDGDALLFEDQGITKVSLAGPDKKPFATVTMDAPVYGIWSHPAPGTPFVCIEPWLGLCDSLDTDKKLENRAHVNHLEKGESFETFYTIEI